MPTKCPIGVQWRRKLYSVQNSSTVIRTAQLWKQRGCEAAMGRGPSLARHLHFSKVRPVLPCAGLLCAVLVCSTLCWQDILHILSQPRRQQSSDPGGKGKCTLTARGELLDRHPGLWSLICPSSYKWDSKSSLSLTQKALSWFVTMELVLQVSEDA